MPQDEYMDEHINWAYKVNFTTLREESRTKECTIKECDSHLKNCILGN